MKRISNRKAIIIYVLVAYVISGIGYALWFLISDKNGMFAFVPIIAIPIAAFTTYFLCNREIRLGIKKISLSGVLIGALIPVFYIGVAVLIYKISGNKIGKLQMTGKEVILLYMQWIFAGFCEEIGWRGVLFPLLKKSMKVTTACVITGILWAGWHMPLIFAGTMITRNQNIVGVLLFVVETTSISFIMGVLSETKWGKSIWTYVAFHAMHNILAVQLLTMIPKDKYILLDSGGFLLEGVIALFAIAVWTIYHRGLWKESRKTLVRMKKVV